MDAEYDRMSNTPVGSWIDHLMLVAKDLSLAVDYGLRPGLQPPAGTRTRSPKAGGRPLE